MGLKNLQLYFVLTMHAADHPELRGSGWAARIIMTVIPVIYSDTPSCNALNEERDIQKSHFISAHNIFVIVQLKSTCADICRIRPPQPRSLDTFPTESVQIDLQQHATECALP